MDPDNNDDDDNIIVIVVVLLLLLSSASIRGRCCRAAFRCAVSVATTVMGWRDANVMCFCIHSTDDVGVICSSVCISIDQFLARNRFELISVDYFWRNVGGSCSPLTAFGATPVRVSIRTDNDGVIRCPVCALVALLGGLTAPPDDFGAT